MKILQLNTTLNTGSIGRIVEGLGRAVLKAGHESFVGAAVVNPPTASRVIRVGSKSDRIWHGVITRILDRHGFGSTRATRALVRRMEEIAPDVVHLHNLHGYYLNIAALFSWLKARKIPVVWTLHDCWAFTGHCAHFERVGCDKWQRHCQKCPNKRRYPASWLIDNSWANYADKRRIVLGVQQLHLVAPSMWLSESLEQSFLSGYARCVIHTGIDLHTFRPSGGGGAGWSVALARKKLVLAVANTWKKKAAMQDLLALSRIMPPEWQLVLVGLERSQVGDLPPNVRGLPRTESVMELAVLYSQAEVFVNPTYVDTLPTTNLEAMACGTPVVTYRTGGSPETVDEATGAVVAKGDVAGLKSAIDAIVRSGKTRYVSACRERAERLFGQDDRWSDYIALYESSMAAAQGGDEAGR